MRSSVAPRRHCYGLFRPCCTSLSPVRLGLAHDPHRPSYLSGRAPSDPVLCSVPHHSSTRLCSSRHDMPVLARRRHPVTLHLRGARLRQQFCISLENLDHSHSQWIRLGLHVGNLIQLKTSQPIKPYIHTWRGKEGHVVSRVSGRHNIIGGE